LLLSAAGQRADPATQATQTLDCNGASVSTEEVPMTDITAVRPKVAGRPRPAARRSPYRAVTDGVRSLLRSYTDHLKADAYIVPTGHIATAARRSC